mgnify:FL=1
MGPPLLPGPPRVGRRPIQLQVISTWNFNYFNFNNFIEAESPPTASASG